MRDEEKPFPASQSEPSASRPRTQARRAPAGRNRPRVRSPTPCGGEQRLRETLEWAPERAASAFWPL
eukprot:6528919-Pyramimonas_sp.AAC.1